MHRPVGPVPDATQLTVFDDGLSAEVDFEPYLAAGPVFAALRDPELFRRATVAGGTIFWPNGADMAPETLYEEVERARQQSTPLRAGG
ncbi:MAG: DUF2442 domain-containing protein [Candidatus Latescibacterota bacterium]